jgi:hypothetical protein
MIMDSEIQGELYHTGLIVDDLHAAMDILTRFAGIQWATPQTIATNVQTSQGPLFRESYYTYSVDGPHHIELIEHRDATAWLTATGGRRVHHLGFWAEDFEGTRARLTELGLPSEIHGLDAKGKPAQLSFHRDPQSGMWFELIDKAVKPAMEKWWAGGPLEA